MLSLARVLVLIGALCIVAVGLLGSGAGLLVSVLDPSGDVLPMVTFSVSFLALTVILGLALVWQSWQSIRGRGSGRFQVRRIWLWVLLYLLAVFAGQLILSLDLLPPVTFPPLHVAAAILPPLIVLALVGHGLKGVARWRGVVLQVGSGAFLSTTLAFALEFAFMLGLLVAVVATVAMQRGGLEVIQTLAERLQDPTWLQDSASQVPLSRSPFVLVAVFLVFAGIVPLVEEGVKTIGVALMGYQRPILPRAFLWGLASGAGFALVENMFNTTSGLDIWAPVALARVGVSLLHCFTGGLMGLAWYQLLIERRWGWGLGLYSASVGVHALWNALAAAMTLISLAAPGGEATDAREALAWLGGLAFLALLVVLALAVGLGLLGLTVYVRRCSLAVTLPAEGGVGLTPAEKPPSGSVVEEAA